MIWGSLVTRAACGFGLFLFALSCGGESSETSAADGIAETAEAAITESPSISPAEPAAAEISLCIWEPGPDEELPNMMDLGGLLGSRPGFGMFRIIDEDAPEWDVWFEVTNNTELEWIATGWNDRLAGNLVEWDGETLTEHWDYVCNYPALVHLPSKGKFRFMMGIPNKTSRFQLGVWVGREGKSKMLWSEKFYFSPDE